jgi:hypothetical protein
MLICLETRRGTVDGRPPLVEQEWNELLERQLTPHHELEQDREINARDDNEVLVVLDAPARCETTTATLQIGEHDGRLIAGHVAHVVGKSVRPESAIAERPQEITIHARDMLDGINEAGRHIAVRNYDPAHA